LTYGKRIPKKFRKVPMPSYLGLLVCGKKLPAKVVKLGPVKVTPVTSSSNGALKVAEMGMLTIAKLKISNKPFEALENVAEPRRLMPVHAIRAPVWRA
jgi:hypothetical protein